MAVAFVNDACAVRTTCGTTLVVPVPPCITCGNLLILAATAHITTNLFVTEPGWTTLNNFKLAGGRLVYLAWRKACSEPANYTLSLVCDESECNWTGWIGQFSGADVCCGPLGLANCSHTTFACNSSNPDTPSSPTACCSGDHLALSYWMLSETFGGDATVANAPTGYTKYAWVQADGACTDTSWAVAGKAFIGTVDDAGAWCTDGTNDYFSLGAILILESSGVSITSLCPTSGPGGTSVTVTGKCFTCADQVRFGGKLADFVITNDTTIVATAPNQNPGKKDVFVRDACGNENTEDANNDFTYLGGGSGGGGKGKGGGSGNKGKGKGGGGGSQTTGAPEPSFFTSCKPGTSETLTANIAFSGENTQQVGIRPSDPSLNIRLMGISTTFGGNTAQGVEYYFGSGANITTNAGCEISEIQNKACNKRTYSRFWAATSGPVGKQGQVFSFRGTADVDEPVSAVIYYKEERKQD